MEKSWENFWTTGKVEDYLSYRNRVGEHEAKMQSTDEAGRTTHKQEEARKDFGSIWDSRLS